MEDALYAAKRAEIENRFSQCTEVEDSIATHKSPSGGFLLTISRYTTGPDTWDYSRGIVRRLSGELIADIKRNYGHFWHAWVQHGNGCEYLLCGEDYQGYTVINLTTGHTASYFPEQGHQGFGFCWADVHPSPDGDILAVDGCYWAAPYEVVFYDFRNPDELPLAEIERIDSLDTCDGWNPDGSFTLVREIEVRKSDGTPYDELPEEEQDRLDEDDDLTDYLKQRVVHPRPKLPPKD